MARPKKSFNEIKTGEPDKKFVKTYETLDECIEKSKQIVLERLFNSDANNVKVRGSVYSYIENTIIEPLVYIKEMKMRDVLGECEIMKSFEYLKFITEQINKSYMYNPTIFTFCKVMSISFQTFNKWASENSDKGEATRLVQDYFRGILSQGMLCGEVNPVSGSFIAKSTLGMRDNDGAQQTVNVIATEKSLEEIMEDFKSTQLLK